MHSPRARIPPSVSFFSLLRHRCTAQNAERKPLGLPRVRERGGAHAYTRVPPDAHSPSILYLPFLAITSEVSGSRSSSSRADRAAGGPFPHDGGARDRGYGYGGTARGPGTASGASGDRSTSSSSSLPWPWQPLPESSKSEATAAVAAAWRLRGCALAAVTVGTPARWSCEDIGDDWRSLFVEGSDGKRPAVRLGCGAGQRSSQLG